MPYRPPAPTAEHFLCTTEEVLARIDAIDPRAYDRTRNDLGGATTWLGPFLTHGIIDTAEIADRVRAAHPVKSCYRLMFELGWREFFHRTWQLEEEAIFGDLHHPQQTARDARPPRGVLEATTSIDAVDGAIAHLLEHGTMHNHARLWTAAIACHFGRTWWKEPARWLHHHLLDGDLASNTLSWQWVAGTFGHKRYLANQDNVNKFAGTRQRDSWLDVPYEAFDGEAIRDFAVPDALAERGEPALPRTLRGTPIGQLEPLSGTVALRSMWDLDPRRAHGCSRSIVFVDTEHLERWPLSDKRWRFVEHWAARCEAPLVHGTLDELARATADAEPLRREYPACADWPGRVAERRWLYPMPDEAFPSFSRYWKQVRASVAL